MNLNELLARLNAVKKSELGWTAKCPAHDDQRPSLSIREVAGRILMHCFADCKLEAITSALGISISDLFTNGPSSRHNLMELPGKIIAVYPYRDEKGSLLYEKIRFHPKGFTLRKPGSNGGFMSTLNGTRRVPYRLPELISRQTDDVFLCEGEKDCDSLFQLGFTASNFKDWKLEFNEFVSGAHVAILADHDIPGLNLAQKVCDLLFSAVASVKLIDLFETEPLPRKNGKDVADYIKALKKEGVEDTDIAAALVERVERTSLWIPGQTPDPVIEYPFEQLLIVKPAPVWLEEAKAKPVPKMLVGVLWFEGEICILFADTNLGKSILAVQIAHSLASGIKIYPFENEAMPQKVIYLDFEMTEKQFESRYSVKQGEFCANHFQFSDNFLRAEINPDSDGAFGAFSSFEDYLNSSIELLIAESGARILIVDNLTYLRSETEKARDALPLMKGLKRLKRKYDLSILVLAHTPKRDLSKPITRNDLQGSKMLINFCDSAFAIGESTVDKNLRYLKQIKARSTEVIYDAENVCVLQIEKSSNFLGFSFIGHEKETEHLKIVTEKDRDVLVAKAKELSKEGKSQREIGLELGIAASTVNKYLRS